MIKYVFKRQINAKLKPVILQEEGKRRRSFYLRIKEKPKNRVERPKYEHMHVIGHVR